ncbi:hypothetical protein ELQ35_00020 [Peribacillus cavernae]|uniref:YkoS n=1 Tax=Peribacillus cavernae TaxID=1674310 RepID=A0A3S0WD29_9BACI|nr:DUF6044 family protein [Peribacillus cavernae]RUQ32849.1 hypothetical protein ELQ35_00020 [Peribacillus cavernae]
MEKNEKRLFIFALLVIALYLSPLILLGENAHIRVHDNLDSNLAWYKVLKESNEIFGSINSRLPQISNGMPRNTFSTEFSVIVWLYTLFPTMAAYTISQALTRVIAFLGMYLLLKKHFLPDKQLAWIRVGTSLAFALTPFWPSGMLSTLGMPLALWAFLNIRIGERHWRNYLVLTLLPLYSSIVLGFFFFLFAMGVLWVTDIIRGKGWNLRFFLSIVYMTLIFCLVEYRLVFSFIFDFEPNSRDEYFHAKLPLWRVIRLIVRNFVLGHVHVMTVHALVILPITVFTFYVIITKKLWRQEKVFVFLFALNFILSTWYAFWFYEGWLPLTERFHFLDTFNFARFHFLRPMIIYVSFALALRIIFTYCEFTKRTLSIFMAAQILLLAAFNEEIINQNSPSVKEFYAERLFQNIKEHIALPQEDYRVANIGIHPAIAQFNGFYTLDTYNNFYPLSYKHQFRKIIENELTKSKAIRIYFDEWGGRCYIFTSELGKHYMYKKDSKKRLKNLELNMEPFKKLGGKYIFSAVPIDNATENHLKLDKIFTEKSAAWKIYLYKVMEDEGSKKTL